MRKTLLGLAAGFTLGYTAVRVRDALLDRKRTIPLRVDRDPAGYAAGKRALMIAGLVRSTASLATLAFAVAPATEQALERVPSRLRLPLLVTAVSLIEALREWPIDYVEGFVLERVYGTSDQHGEAWAADRVKGLLIGLPVAAVMTFLGDAVLRRAPRRWPMIVTALTPPLLAFANIIVPVFVMPLFNKYTPVDGKLEATIRELAARYGAGGASILRFDMSRQTKKANAFVVGVLGTQRIALADTLIEHFADDETLFVVAHELGHYVRRDPWIGIAFGSALLGATVFAAEAIVRRAHGDEPIARPAAVLQLAFWSSLFQLLEMPLGNAFSRAIERRADRFALAATNDADSGMRAFTRLRDQNLAEDEAPAWAEFLFSSHPSIKSRVAALESANRSK